MTFKHKLSRRLAALTFAAVAALLSGCADSPMSPAAEVIARPVNLDPALAVSSSSAVGQRVVTDRYVQVFSQMSRSSAIAGTQPDRVQGTVLEGPSALTSAEPYALFRVNFDSGADGWVL